MEKTNSIREGMDVAVIGMAVRLPGAPDIPTFWQNLLSGKECITKFSREELLAAGVPESLVDHKDYVPSYGKLENLDEFDAPFFGFTPHEADILDPQIRIFLECAWNAFEDAGYTPKDYEGNTGVYAGASSLAYWGGLSILAREAGNIAPFLAQLLLNKDSLSSLTAHKLDLMGPSVTVQTACSTGLVAVHTACQGLLNGECDLALAGGVTVSLPQTAGYLYQEGLLYSSDGHNRTMDAGADGTVFGNGGGAVLLKRADEALADGDHIYAIVKGSATNNDGKRKAGYAATSQEGQRQVVRSAMYMAEFDPETVDFVEMHGTGTSLGDPLEVAALTEAYSTSEIGYCALGSVKSNLGHLDAAAGIAGFIKAVLSIHHLRLPPSISFFRPNPRIEFMDSPFYVNSLLSELKSHRGPVRGGVSAFGVGGANAHVLLEERPEKATMEKEEGLKLLCLSAQSDGALARRAEGIRRVFLQNPETSLEDLCYSMQVGRIPFRFRSFLIARESEDLVQQLAGKGVSGNGRVPEPLPPLFVALDELPEFDLAAWKQGTRQFPEFKSLFEILDSALSKSALSGAAKTSAERMGVAWAVLRFLEGLGLRIGGYLGANEGEFLAGLLAGSFDLEPCFKMLKQGADALPADFAQVEIKRGTRAIWSAIQGDWLEQGGEDKGHWEDVMNGMKKDIRKAVDVPSGAHCIHFSSQENSSESFSLSPDLDPGHALLQLIGKLWSSGHDLDWQKFHAGKKRNRIPLPGYPFDPHPYPLREIARETMVEALDLWAGGEGSKERAKSLKDWFYKPVWHRRSSRNNSHRDLAVPTLIFLPKGPMGELLKAESLKNCPECIFVLVGSEFARLDQHSFSLNPSRADDYKGLSEALSSSGFRPRHVIHAWPLESLAPDADFYAIQEIGFLSLIHLVKELSSAKWTDGGVGLTALSSQVFDVLGTEELCPPKATLMAAMKVIPQEYPGINCLHIDVEESPKGLSEIWKEMENGGGEAAFALRGGKRWTEAFVPEEMPLEEREQEKVVLVTGGLGNLGLMVADEMADRGVENLVLTSRSGLPDPASWDDETLPSGTRQRIAAVRKLEAKGCAVEVAAVDAADAEAMKGLFHRLAAAHGKIDMVFHSAGVIGDFSLISDCDEAHFKRQFAPKVAGMYALDKALEGIEVGCVIASSSMSSLLGGLGHAGYTAGNIFMDAFVTAYNRKHGANWLSANIEAFEGAEDAPENDLAIGFGTHEVTLNAGELRRGVSYILDARPVDRIIFAKGDLKERIDQWILLKGQGMEEMGGGSKTLRPRPELGTPPVPPKGEVEARILAIWETFFGYEGLGVTDNFFQLGGDSLKSILLIEKMGAALGRKVAVGEFFQNPTPRGLAEGLGTIAVAVTAVESELDPESFPLSPGQRSMLLVDRMEGGIANNLIHVSEVKGDVDQERLKSCFQQLVQRHEALRTAFSLNEGAPSQRVLPGIDFEIEVLDIDEEEESEKVTAFRRPFDIAQPPLFRIGLIRSPRRSLFLLDIHHIISDPATTEILLKEFIAIYNGRELPPNPSQYREFIAWQQAYFNSPQYAADERWWLKSLENRPKTLNLPLDFDRPALMEYEGALEVFELSEENKIALQEVASASGTTLFITLYSLYFTFLARISVQDSLVIGTPVSLRREEDIQQTVGLFINLLPIQADTPKEKRFSDLLREVHEGLTAAYQHAAYPFDHLQEKLLSERDPSRNALVETGFTILPHMPNQDMAEAGIQFGSYEMEDDASKYDFFLWVLEGKDLECHFYYRKKLFRPETIREFVGYFKRIVAAVLANPDVPIGDISIFGEEKKEETTDLFDDGEDFAF